MNCLGTALQAAFKLLQSTGGRITIVNASRPAYGVGVLMPRESARRGTRGSKCSSGSSGSIGGAGEVDAQLLQPQTDYYKRLSLDANGAQMAIDVFQLGEEHVDLATLGMFYSAFIVFIV